MRLRREPRIGGYWSLAVLLLLLAHVVPFGLVDSGIISSFDLAVNSWGIRTHLSITVCLL